MTAPVNNQQPQPRVQQENPVRPAVPRGLGAAPTTLQGAQQPPASEEKGRVEQFVLYIKDCVISIKDYIVGLFQKIVSWWKPTPPVQPAPESVREPAPPEPAPPPQPAPDPDRVHRELLGRIDQLHGIEIWRRFNEYVTDETSRKIAFVEIGFQYGSGRFYAPSYESQGKTLAERNPKYLVPALKARIESQIQNLPAAAAAAPAAAR